MDIAACSLPFLVVTVVREAPLSDGGHDQLALPQVAHLHQQGLLSLVIGRRKTSQSCLELIVELYRARLKGGPQVA